MNVQFCEAKERDLPLLVRMLADDELGAKREELSEPLNARYQEAFQNIAKDPNNELLLAKLGGEIVGMLQITFIPYLTHIGSWRCLIEGVRVHAEYRGKGLGRVLLNRAIERAREKGCSMVQLASDKQRSNAIRFYESLGFVASHEGFKLKL